MCLCLTTGDISQAAREKLTDAARQLLIRERVPPGNFTYPKTKFKDERKKSGFSFRSCNPSLFQDYSSLTYSYSTDSVFCLPCALFPATVKGNNSQVLVTKGCNNWKKVNEVVRDHMRDIKGTHASACVSMDHFLKVLNGEMRPIDQSLNKQVEVETVQNRLMLTSILETLILCGRQGIALRGHRDDGSLIDNDMTDNDGNFRALLRYRMKGGDEALLKHIGSCTKRATYISKETQNSLLSLIRTDVLRQIVDEIRSQSGKVVFSVIADEVTDQENLSQLGISIRYVDATNSIKDRCIGFKPLDSLTGRNVAHTLLAEIGKLGLEVTDTVGLGFDGAGNMAGRFI